MKCEHEYTYTGKVFVGGEVQTVLFLNCQKCRYKPTKTEWKKIYKDFYSKVPHEVRSL